MFQGIKKSKAGLSLDIRKGCIWCQGMKGYHGHGDYHGSHCDRDNLKALIKTSQNCKIVETTLSKF